jgi:hypothetical protein
MNYKFGKRKNFPAKAQRREEPKTLRGWANTYLARFLGVFPLRLCAFAGGCLFLSFFLNFETSVAKD